MSRSDAYKRFRKIVTLKQFVDAVDRLLLSVVSGRDDLAKVAFSDVERLLPEAKRLVNGNPPHEE